MGSYRRLKIILLFRDAYAEFKKNDPLRLAGATAFFTTFALPAVLIILIQVFGIILNPRFVSRQLFKNLSDIFGQVTATDIHRILFNMRHIFQHWYEIVLGFLFLIFVATTLLKVIKDSLNQIWNIKVEKPGNIKSGLTNRLKSFAVILFAGILFMIVLLTEGLIHFLNHNPDGNLFSNSEPVFKIIRQVIGLILMIIWFALLFKFLPDGRPGWKTVIVGGIFTGILFTIGKIILQWQLSYSNIETIYGASTSSVLLLLFVFYSSFIFYFGACFTKVWAEYQNTPIPPAANAIKFEWAKVKT
jgi:membrane protein